MADPNLVDFYERVGRLQSDHKRGLGFEAAGTLSRSRSYRKPRKRHTWIAPLLFIILCVFTLKGAIHFVSGAKTYESRVAQLQEGQGFDKLGAWVMQADPVTVYISGIITRAWQ